MVRVKQFADDLGISKNQAKGLINKGRNRKDGGSQILEKVLADKDKNKKKKKKEKKFRTAEYRIEMDGDGEFTPELAPRKRFNPKKDGDDFMPDMEGGRAMADGGLQDIPSDNRGLPNLPTEVRNKMGYKKDGGVLKMSRGGGIAIQGLGFKGVR